MPQCRTFSSAVPGAAVPGAAVPGAALLVPGAGIREHPFYCKVHDFDSTLELCCCCVVSEHFHFYERKVVLSYLSLLSVAGVKRTVAYKHIL